MNILHFSTHDGGGGAAKATYLIHALLRSEGHNSILAVQRKSTTDPDVVKIGCKAIALSGADALLERVGARFAGWRRVKTISGYPFNLNITPIPDTAAIIQAMPQPDVIFLHWTKGFLTVGDIRRQYEKFRCPIVWVLMDMEPMTGGCHCPVDCEQYRTACSRCPQLAKKPEWVERTWAAKMRDLSGLPITFVVQTAFQRDILMKSGLFTHVNPMTIPSPIHRAMKPFDKKVVREMLDLPKDKKIILAGSQKYSERLKGGDLFRQSLQVLKHAYLDLNIPGAVTAGDILVLTIGGYDGDEKSLGAGFEHRHVGYIREEMIMALMFQAADVFASSSIFEAGSQMVSQSMLCGTPVVAFNTGNAPELLGDGRGGYMARLGDVEDFSNGLWKMLNDDGTAGRNAAKSAADYQGPNGIASAFRELLRKVVAQDHDKLSTMQCT